MRKHLWRHILRCWHRKCEGSVNSNKGCTGSKQYLPRKNLGVACLKRWGGVFEFPHTTTPLPCCFVYQPLALVTGDVAYPQHELSCRKRRGIVSPHPSLLVAKHFPLPVVNCMYAISDGNSYGGGGVPGALLLHSLSRLEPQICPPLEEPPNRPRVDRKPSLQSTLHKPK